MAGACRARPTPGQMITGVRSSAERTCSHQMARLPRQALLRLWTFTPAVSIRHASATCAIGPCIFSARCPPPHAIRASTSTNARSAGTPRRMRRHYVASTESPGCRGGIAADRWARLVGLVGLHHQILALHPGHHAAPVAPDVPVLIREVLSPGGEIGGNPPERQILPETGGAGRLAGCTRQAACSVR
jgi:hypothetical protein